MFWQAGSCPKACGAWEHNPVGDIQWERANPLNHHHCLGWISGTRGCRQELEPGPSLGTEAQYRLPSYYAECLFPLLKVEK